MHNRWVMVMHGMVRQADPHDLTDCTWDPEARHFEGEVAWQPGKIANVFEKARFEFSFSEDFNKIEQGEIKWYFDQNQNIIPGDTTLIQRSYSRRVPALADVNCLFYDFAGQQEYYSSHVRRWPSPRSPPHLPTPALRDTLASRLASNSHQPNDNSPLMFMPASCPLAPLSSSLLAPSTRIPTVDSPARSPCAGLRFFPSQHIFLTERALYILAFDLTKYSAATFGDQVLFWANAIQERVPGSKVVVVGTHADELPAGSAGAVCDKVATALRNIRRRAKRVLDRKCRDANAEVWPLDQIKQSHARYGTFRLNFHHSHRFELDLRGHTRARGAAFSCLRLKLADIVLI